MQALWVQMADADRAEAVREVPESVLGQGKDWRAAPGIQVLLAHGTQVHGLRRIVSLRNRGFAVAEHGAEVFEWAATKGWEGVTFDWLDRVLGPDVTFLDIGAWIGVMTLYASGRCKRIVAVEPDPVAFNTLCENCAGKAETYQQAIGSGDGKVMLWSGMLGASTTRQNPAEGRGIGEGHEYCEAWSSTLPRFVADAQIEEPLCVKIDAEGMEEEILTSSLDWLIEHKPKLLVELHPYWWKEPERVWEVIGKLTLAYSGAKQHGEHIAFGS